MRFFLYGLVLLNSVVFISQLFMEDTPAPVIVAVERGVEPLVLVQEKLREDELQAKELARLKQQKIDEEKKRIAEKKAKAEEAIRLKQQAKKAEKERIKAEKQQAKEAARLKRLAVATEKKRLKAAKLQANEAARLKQLAIKAEKKRIKAEKQQIKEAARLEQLALKARQKQTEQKKQQAEAIITANKEPVSNVIASQKKQADIIKTPELYCYRMGIFKLKKEVDLTLTGLNALDYNTSTGVDYSAASKFLVYLPAYPSLKDAQKATEGLVAKGVIDFQILAVYGKANGISLGVFRQHAIAEERVKEIRNLGYEPVLQAISGKLGYYIDFNKRNKFALSDEESRFLRETSKNIKISRINCSL